jgi:hypothetical protein
MKRWTTIFAAALVACSDPTGTGDGAGAGAGASGGPGNAGGGGDAGTATGPGSGQGGASDAGGGPGGGRADGGAADGGHGDGGACTPSCGGKTCGSDGCGGTCGACAKGSFCSAAGSCASASSQALNVVFFGNSFTQCWGGTDGFAYDNYNGIPSMVRDLAAAAGFPRPRTLAVATGGYALSDHLANLDAAVERPSGYAWDVVVLQELSDKPTAEYDPPGGPAAFAADAATLLGRMRAASPSAVGVLYETWAYGAANDWYRTTGAATGGPPGMQTELHDNYLAAFRSLEASHAGAQKIAYVGELFRAQGFADWLYTSDPTIADSKHPSDDACYLAAMALFATIYGAQTAGLPALLSDISPDRAQKLQQMMSALPPSP